MKKKILIIIVIIIVILIALFLINLGRNYFILRKICDSNTDFKTTLNNYYYEENTEYASALSPTQDILYAYNGIYLLKTYDDGNPYVTSWYDSSTNESVSFDETGLIDNNLTNFAEYYKNVLLNGFEDDGTVIGSILSQNLFTPFSVKDGCYVINFNDSTVSINTKTYLIEKKVSGDTTKTYKIEKDSVTSEDVPKPDSL